MRQTFLTAKRPLTVLPLLLPLTLTATLSGGLSGCGGGKNENRAAQSPASPTTSGAGRATFTIRWPQETPASRLIPKVTRSIVVSVYYDPRDHYLQLGNHILVDRKTIVREEGQETATVTFDNLPIDGVLVRADAYATQNGTGAAAALGYQFVTVTEDAPATIKLTMNSTIKALNITPTNASVQALRYRQLIATAYDTTATEYGNVILTSPDKLEWSSSDPSIARIDADGLVTGLKPGRVTITVRDTESGVSVGKVFNVNDERNTPAQFSPHSHEFAPTRVPGEFTASGDTYVFDSDALTLTDTTTGVEIARGQRVVRTKDAKTFPYAVFTFAGDIRIGGGSRVTGRGSCPIVLLTRGNFTLDGNAKIDVSANGDTPGPGGYGVAQGPKRGWFTDEYEGYNWRGGGGFLGRGGGWGYSTPYFEEEFPQGGSGGYLTGAGGGAIYIASGKNFTIRDATVMANGGGLLSDPANRTGGAGGSLYLWSGQTMTLTRATVEAKGGASYGVDGTTLYGSGGGGFIYYGWLFSTPVPTGTSTLNVDGGPVRNNDGPQGGKGGIYNRAFEGF